MLEAGIVNLLLNDATLSGLVGPRIYPVLLPEMPTYPALTYMGITASSKFTFDRKETATKRMQFDAYGDYGTVRAVLIALNNVLNAYSGTLNDGTRVLAIFSLNEMDHYESEGRVYRSIAEYRVEYLG